MSRPAVTYSAEQRGCLYVPTEGMPTAELYRETVAAIRHTLSALELPGGPEEVARIYGEDIADDKRITRDLRALLAAKKGFEDMAGNKPSRRIPLSILFKHGSKLSSLIMRIHPSGSTTHHMAQLAFPEPRSATRNDTSVVFSLGVRPLGSAAPAFEMKGGKVLEVNGRSAWTRTAPIDWLLFSPSANPEVDEQGLLRVRARYSGVVAMGDMVEPLLDANGLGELYETWIAAS